MTINDALGIILGNKVHPTTQQPYSEKSPEYREANQIIQQETQKRAPKYEQRGLRFGENRDDLASLAYVRILTKGLKNRKDGVTPKPPNSGAKTYIDTIINNYLIDKERRQNGVLVTGMPQYKDGTDVEIEAEEEDSEEVQRNQEEGELEEEVESYEQNFYASWINEMQNRSNQLSPQTPTRVRRIQGGA